MNLYPAAVTWANAGCSVIPIRADGTKKPVVEWKPFQHERPDPMALKIWYNTAAPVGVGVVCGAVSGGLEMLELEGRAASTEHFDKIYAECDKRGISWLLDTLTQHGYCEATPSGGFHFLYRISDHEVPGNTKVAQRPATEQELLDNPRDKVKVLSETRGEGGYVIVAPTGGTVHPSGDSWSVVAGEIGVIPTVAWMDRCTLHEAIHAALDEMPAPVMREPVKRALPFQRDGLSPGDDFCQRATWDEILTPHGWSITEYRGNETFWMRPGKKFEGKGSHSATTGFKGDGAEDRLYVFSTSTEFDAERPYNKFAAYTLLEHRGDFAAAAKELARRGYGARAGLPAVAYQSAPLDVAARVEPVVQQAAEVAVPQQAVMRDRDLVQLGDGFPAMDRNNFRTFPWTDSGMVGIFGDAMSGHLRYVSQDKGWKVWDGKQWIEDHYNSHDRAMQRIADVALGQAQQLEAQGDPSAEKFGKFAASMNTLQRLSGVPKAARAHSKIAASADDFDNHKHLVTVDNGVLDLRTGTLQPHDPKWMLTRKMNTSFNPAAGTGRWGTFMEEVLPDTAVRGYLQRALGYALLGEPNQRALFLLHGESGSGKSQVIEAINMVFGDFGVSIPPSALLPKPKGGVNDDVHLLRGKRMAFTSELNENAVINESLIKSATGGDTQATRALYGKYVQWRPEFVVFIATNFLPRISSTDNAIWRRVKPIKFEQVFIDADGNPLDVDGADKGVRIAQEEPESILNWLLEGLAQFREHGLTPPEAVREWTQNYRDEVDTVRQFISEGESEGRLKLDPNSQTPFRELYKAYAAWCDDAQLKHLPAPKFNQSMESNGWKREKRERGVMWQGIGLLGFVIESQTPAAQQWWKDRPPGSR